MSLESLRRRSLPASKSALFPNVLETLEARQMLCMDHVMQQQHVIELLQSTVSRPGAKPVKGGVAPTAAGGGLNSVADAADIIWVNRGTTDNFGIFGTLANTARAVVDAVIVSYERMIGSFNYGAAGQTYSLTLSMSGGGFGASANLNSSLGGKPKSGTISMGTGNNDGNANSDNGWFMDPTPFESSEFMSSIVNGYSGNATNPGPAFNKGDFFTVVAAEMTHCMGLFGSALAGWSSHTTNTGIADTAAAPGFLYVYQGPSIKHLLTSDNGGFQDFGSAVHSSEPGNTISFGGDTYVGADDQGNAFYEFGRRYMINNVFALMFKDSYNYATIDPAKWGTMYSVLNETTKLVTVRGGTGTNNDTISVTRTGNTVFVSVDPATDVPGTGALPGAGNLPAFVTEYDISQISNISIAAGAGNDTISIAPNIGVPITVDASTGTDGLTIVGTSGDDTIGVAAGTITGVSTITYSNFESLAVQGNDGNDTINFNGTGLSNVNVTGGIGDDILNLTNVTNSSLVFDLGGDANTLNLNSGAYTIASDLGAVGTMTVNINAGTLTFNTTQHLTSLSVASGASGSLLAGGTRAMVLGGLSIVGTGNFDLNDNDAIIDYAGASQMNAIRAMINSARNGGPFTGNGLNSTNARNASPKNTTLGAMEGSEYHAINGPASTFAGESFDDSSILVKYTWYGDVDYNGIVDFDDYSRVDAGFNGNKTGWMNGDVDGNGIVDFDDYSLIDLAFNTQIGVL